VTLSRTLRPRTINRRARLFSADAPGKLRKPADRGTLRRRAEIDLSAARALDEPVSILVLRVENLRIAGAVKMNHWCPRAKHTTVGASGPKFRRV
jgi:hypothetical protein